MGSHTRGRLDLILNLAVGETCGFILEYFSDFGTCPYIVYAHMGACMNGRHLTKYECCVKCCLSLRLDSKSASFQAIHYLTALRMHALYRKWCKHIKHLWQSLFLLEITKLHLGCLGQSLRLCLRCAAITRPRPGSATDFRRLCRRLRRFIPATIVGNQGKPIMQNLEVENWLPAIVEARSTGYCSMREG